MYISRSFLVALLSAPFLAFAQDKPNPFNINGEIRATAGQPLTLTWNPTTQGTISLILRSGNSGDLAEGTTIADGLDNSGSYTWDVPDSVTRGADYTIEIVSDSNPDQTNYTPPFTLESTNTSPQSTGEQSLGASSTMSTAPASVSPSAFPLQSGITIDTSAHSTTSGSSATRTESNSASTTASMSATDSASSSSASATDSSASDSTMMTMTSSASESSSASSSSSRGAASATNSDSDLQASGSSTSEAGAAKATAMVGMLGVVALGALAL